MLDSLHPLKVDIMIIQIITSTQLFIKPNFSCVRQLVICLLPPPPKSSHTTSNKRMPLFPRPPCWQTRKQACPLSRYSHPTCVIRYTSFRSCRTFALCIKKQRHFSVSKLSRNVSAFLFARLSRTTKKPKTRHFASLRPSVDRQGLEPWTPWLRVRCSTNWASGPFILFCAVHQRLDYNNKVTDECQHLFSNFFNFFWIFSQRRTVAIFLDFSCAKTPT